MVTQTVNLNELEISLQQLVGIENKNIRHIEKNYEVNIHGRDAYLSIDGSEVNVNNTVTFIRLAASVIKRYERLDVQEFEYLFDVVRLNQTDRFIEMMDEVLTRSFTGKPIRPKTLGQKVFIDAFKQSDLTFAIGPAGTGKTFLAVCYAVELLKKGEIQKIILTRPAVEAGENLGFLPGDLKEKVDPYLRPLYDALDDMLSPERVQRYMDKGVIEIAPLAYMRGRTLDDAMIILDEAQNTTKAQMMMFLSRLGRNSKMIVTGDVDQIDLPRHQRFRASCCARLFIRCSRNSLCQFITQ
ncbi:PhoH family protein [Erysipelothrix sp. Poltava]|nr:PhoH family protein [Erysipelothrix sp. Poltava]